MIFSEIVSQTEICLAGTGTLQLFYECIVHFLVYPHERQMCRELRDDFLLQFRMVFVWWVKSSWVHLIPSNQEADLGSGSSHFSPQISNRAKIVLSLKYLWASLSTATRFGQSVNQCKSKSALITLLPSWEKMCFLTQDEECEF